MEAKNDTVIIEVKNSLLTENTAIQWHRIRQNGTPWLVEFLFVVDRVRTLYSLSVVPGKTFLVRIGSLTALSALSSQIEGHSNTAVEADDLSHSW
uniref:Plastocyanin-like domain-containing protein n=1 Tax=Salix viminalis TaxID=40686 RepID=A0A6N2LU28_SALVM